MRCKNKLDAQLVPPFAWVNGQPYSVVNFKFDKEHKIPSLRKLLDRLIQHYNENEVILLRPMTKKESCLLKEWVDNAMTEAWSIIVVKDGDQFRARK